MLISELALTSEYSITEPFYISLSKIANVTPITCSEGNNYLLLKRELDSECSNDKGKMNYKRIKNQKLRMLGQQYTGFKKTSTGKYFQDSMKPARKLGEKCDSTTCLRSKVINCEKFSESERENIFKKFWQLSWEEKKMFVCSLIDTKPTGRRITKTIDSRRTITKVYYLKLNENKERVCRKTFLRTLGIKEWTIRYWLGERPNNDK